jgi:hypothetical protein
MMSCYARGLCGGEGGDVSGGGFVMPNVRAKVGPAVWRAGHAAQNGPKAPRRRPSVPRRWDSP